MQLLPYQGSGLELTKLALPVSRIRQSRAFRIGKLDSVFPVHAKPFEI